MIELTAIAVVSCFAFFLISIGAFMVLRPLSALAILRRMGSTARIHFTELGLRFLAGAGLYFVADLTSHMRSFHIAGAFLMITSVIIMVVPHRLHNAYALWWADRLPPASIRIFGLVAILAVMGLIYAMILGFKL